MVTHTKLSKECLFYLTNWETDCENSHILVFENDDNQVLPLLSLVPDIFGFLLLLLRPEVYPQRVNHNS